MATREVPTGPYTVAATVLPLLPVLLLLLITLTGCSAAAPQVPPSAVVTVYALDAGKDEPAHGTGFLVGPGQLITTRHVIGGRTPVTISDANGRRQRITETVADDVGSGLALLRVEGTGDALRLSDRMPERGEHVWVITTRGIQRVTLTAPLQDSQIGPVLTFDGPRIVPGDSGAPVVEAQGAVVGVVRGEIEGRTEVVPAKWIRELLKE